MSEVRLESNDRGGFSRLVVLEGGPKEDEGVTETVGSFWKRHFSGKDAADYDIAHNGVPKPLDTTLLRHKDGFTVGVRKQDGGS